VPTLPAAVPLQDPCIPSASSCAASSEVSASIADAIASTDLDVKRKATLDVLKRDVGRPVDACQQRAYKVCQSMWAAEYEKRSYVTPSRDEDIFKLDDAGP
jgi:hypothetical protein